MYNPEFFDRLCGVLHEVIPQFNERRFIFHIFNTEWPDLELKQRTHQVTMALHETLPKEFPVAAQMIDAIAKRLRQQKENEDYYPFVFLVEYMEQYGQRHLEGLSRAGKKHDVAGANFLKTCARGSRHLEISKAKKHDKLRSK